MAQQNKIVGYTTIFGFVLPDWVDEGLVRQVVAIMLTILVMLAVFFFVINPKFSTIASLKASLKTKEANLASLKSSLQEYEKLNDQVPEGTQNMVLAAIPLNYSPDEAIFLLRKLSSETGVSIVSYKLPGGDIYSTASDTNTKKTNGNRMVDFSVHPLRITVSAPVPALLSFIDKIESSLPYGVVSDVNMQEVTKMSSTSKSIQMELEVKYYQAGLNKVDITKIKPLTAEDLSLAQNISRFSLFTIAAESVSEFATGSGTVNTNIFGM